MKRKFIREKKKKQNYVTYVHGLIDDLHARFVLIPWLEEETND